MQPILLNGTYGYLGMAPQSRAPRWIVTLTPRAPGGDLAEIGETGSAAAFTRAPRRGGHWPETAYLAVHWWVNWQPRGLSNLGHRVVAARMILSIKMPRFCSGGHVRAADTHAAASTSGSTPSPVISCGRAVLSNSGETSGFPLPAARTAPSVPSGPLDCLLKNVSGLELARVGGTMNGGQNLHPLSHEHRSTHDDHAAVCLRRKEPRRRA